MPDPSAPAASEPTPGPSATQPLTLTRNGAGTVLSTPAGVSCGSTCSAPFATGAAVTLAATPAAGYTFSGWTGAGCSGTAACAVTMSQARTVMANFTPAAVTGTRYVDLTLAAGPVASRVAVRTGVPFPIGHVTDVARLRLEGAAGHEVAAQFDALARWPDGSIKVALAHVVTDLGAAGAYRVAYGPNIVRAPLPRPIVVTPAGASPLTIDTGLLRFTVNAQGIVDKVWRDTDGNGSFAAGEQVIDQGDVFVAKAADGVEYTASAATDAVVTVEDNGPLRAVVKATGSLTSADGTRLVKYLVRYQASQGSDKVDIEASIVDDRLEADVEKLPAQFAFAARALGLRWRYVADAGATYRFGGQDGTAYGGTAIGEKYLLQSGKFHYVDGEDKGHTFSYSGVGSGTKAPGWVALDAGSRNVALMVKDFWQQFPNELSVDGGTRTLTASLFPSRSIVGAADTSAPAPTAADYRRANTLYFARPGGAKTYQLRLSFGAASPSTSELVASNDSFQRHRLDLMATPAWYTASGVFGDLSPATSTGTRGYDAMLMNDIYQASIERVDGNATMFGWRDHGDRLRAGWNVVNDVRVPSFYNDTHVGANNFFKVFVRTGDPRWYQLAVVSTRHFMDIDVAHGPRAGYWNTGGVAQPAGEVHAISHENIDHQVRNLHWGHAHVSGLSDQYLLTGDKRALDVLKEIGGWWKFVAPHFFKQPFAMADRYREAERDYAWPLYVMNEYVRVTGDAQYHKDTAGALVKYLDAWFRTPATHIGYNPANGVLANVPAVGTNDAAAGTGFWTMTRMDNYGTVDKATGTNPWMAGPLLGNLIKFYEADKQFAAAGKGSGVDLARLAETMLQGMNYVYKHGHDGARGYFAYSETIRGYSGGDNHLLYPLAWLDRLYQQELASGRITHPEWYDTRPKWGPYAKRRFDELNALPIGANTQSYGFYGYEILYPLDYFKVMKDTLGQ